MLKRAEEVLPDLAKLILAFGPCRVMILADILFPG